MTRAAAAALFALAAACAAPAASPAPAPAPGQPAQADTCGMARHVNLMGVRAAEIDRSQLPPGARIICPTCLVTQDYSAERLNLFTSTEGRVSSMRCG